MILLKKKVEKSQEFLKEYSKKTGRKYEPSFEDNLFNYHLLDKDYKPIVREEKIWNDKKMGFEFVKKPIIYNGEQLTTLKQMGQDCEVLSQSELNYILSEINSNSVALKKAEKNGYEKARKEFEKQIKDLTEKNEKVISDYTSKVEKENLKKTEK